MAFSKTPKEKNKRAPVPPDRRGETSSGRSRLRGHSYWDQMAMLSPFGPLPGGMDPSDRHLFNYAPQAAPQTEAAVDPLSDGIFQVPQTLEDVHENPAPDPRDHHPTFTGPLYEKHQEMAQDMEVNENISKWTVEFVNLQWLNNKGRYETVAQVVDMPAELICAIHIREASGNFNTYLHQGDPLGKQAVNHPADIPIFHKWEDAAIHALEMRHQTNVREDLGMVQETTDLAAMATFAEYYNGLGYHYKGEASPYVYAQTNKYESGKYVSDGKYDPNVVDENPGVMAILKLLNNPDFAVDTRPIEYSTGPHGE